MPTNQELIDKIEAALDGAMKTPVNSDRQLNEVFQGFVQELAHTWPDIKRALERNEDYIGGVAMAAEQHGRIAAGETARDQEK